MPRQSKLRNQLNLIMILLFVLGVCISGFVLSNILHKQAEAEVTYRGEALMNMVSGIRSYTSDYIEKNLSKKMSSKDEFMAETVPAYAARKIFASFMEKEKFAQYSYKEAALNPTNLDDTADEFEAQLIESFIKDATRHKISGYCLKSGQKFYFISYPMKMEEASCLQCHSTPAVAPQQMLEIYGDKNGFGWQLDQIVAAQTIYLPAGYIDWIVKEKIKIFLPVLGGFFAVIILIINFLINRKVVKPITQLTKVAKKLSDRRSLNLEELKLENLAKLSKRGDESGQLAKAFQYMAEVISTREQYLHQAVANRTRELRQEIKVRAKAEKALARQVQRVLLQDKITQEIRQSLDTQKILQTAVNNIGKTFQVSRCQIIKYINTNAPKGRVVAEYLISGFPQTTGLELSLDSALCLRKALSQEEAVHWSNVYDSPMLQPCEDLYRQLQINSLLTARTSYQGQVNGAISVQQCNGFREWNQDEIELMEAVAAQVGIALAQAGLLEREKRRRQELEAAKQEAEGANRAKSGFLANISHELRTPLNAIIGFSQLMNRDPAITPEQQETINIINRSGEHLLEMINEVLEMSKIEAGKTTLNLNDFDLYLLLDSLEEMLRVKAQGKNLQLIFEHSPEVPQYVCTDEGKLRQVLINLIGNAVKFTATGSVVVNTFLISREQNHATIQFRIKDTGAGIAEEELEQIFQVFTQSETGRQSKEGTGLGLPISKQFVELMGGRLKVNSILGKGSVFSFQIQCQLGNEGKICTPSTHKIIAIAPGQPTYRILVVEDNWQSRLLMVKLLTKVGFEVETAENGEEAIRIWEKWQPHLIWMDMRMPVMDGYAATKYIKKQPQGENTAIIALTASAFEKKRAEVMAAGCDSFLRKPFQEHELFAKMSQYLGVEYLEEGNSENLTGETEESASSSPLTPESLQVMPSEWLAKLHQAASGLDEEEILTLIEEIDSEYGDLAKALRDLVNNFQFESIVMLTQK